MATGRRLRLRLPQLALCSGHGSILSRCFSPAVRLARSACFDARLTLALAWSGNCSRCGFPGRVDADRNRGKSPMHNDWQATHDWGALTRAQVAAARDAGALPVLTVGAVEQHSDHLPVDTDTVSAYRMALAAAER